MAARTLRSALAALLLLLVSAGVASASPDGHGWALLQVDESGSAVLLHLPPRQAGDRDDLGVIRLVRRFGRPDASEPPRLPEATAFWADRFFMAYGPRPAPEGDRLRRVLQISVRRSIGGGWEYVPADRARMLAPLPGAGDLEGFVGTPAGPAALLREYVGPGLDPGRVEAHPRVRQASPQGDPVRRLLILAGTEWVGVPLPWDGGSELGDVYGGDTGVHPPDPRSVCVLLSRTDGLAVLVQPPQGDRAVLWHGEFDRRWPGTGAPGIVWNESGVSLADPFRVEGRLDATGVVSAGDRLIWAGRDADGALLLALVRGDDTHRLAVFDDLPRNTELAAPGDGSVLALLWPGEKERRASLPRLMIREVSIATGRVLYDGASRRHGPISQRDFQLLMALLVGVMIAVLAFLLRPDQPAKGVLLPAGLRVAEPSRRVLGGMIDYAPAMVLASFLHNTHPADFFSAQVLMGQVSSAFPLLTSLVFAFGHTSVSEWLFGRSLGKAITGCLVVSMPVERGEGAKGDDAEAGSGKESDLSAAPAAGAPMESPRLWQSLARNFVRWGAPPLAVLMFFDRQGRHIGDVVGQTLVVRHERRPEGERPAGDSGPG